MATVATMSHLLDSCCYNVTIGLLPIGLRSTSIKLSQLVYQATFVSIPRRESMITFGDLALKDIDYKYYASNHPQDLASTFCFQNYALTQWNMMKTYTFRGLNQPSSEFWSSLIRHKKHTSWIFGNSLRLSERAHTQCNFKHFISSEMLSANDHYRAIISDYE